MMFRPFSNCYRPKQLISFRFVAEGDELQLSSLYLCLLSGSIPVESIDAIFVSKQADRQVPAYLVR